MKKLVTTLLVAVLAIVAMAATQIWFYLSDGRRTPYEFSAVDSISIAKPGVLQVSPVSKSFSSSGGRFTITVQANKPWTATVSDPTALTLSTASGYGNGTVTCVAVPNGDEVPYSAVVTFTLEDGTTASLPVTVEAAQVEPARLTLSPTSKSVEASGERFTVTVTSNKPWSVSCNQSWVTLSATNGSGNGSFSVLVAANGSNTADNATITVTTATGNVTQTIAVSRAGISSHEYVDLGLPSGTLWATRNVGANSPEEYGDYFAWGETTPKTYFGWNSYKYGSESHQLTKYCVDSSYGLNGFTDSKTVLEAEDDAATANWGSGWRMPTSDEMYELYSECTSVWTTLGEKSGRLFTGPNGNIVFLPAAGRYFEEGFINAGDAGFYWSSSLITDFSSESYSLFSSLNDVRWNYYALSERYFGYSIRPVMTNKNPTAAYLHVDVSERSLGAEGGEFTVNVTSNKSWSVSCNQSWVTLSATSGSGNGSFSVLVAANESNTADNATITVTTATGYATRTIAVSRAANVPHEYVDLGLPSGTLWATCNVGANSPEEYGDYFAWGETTPKSYYDWSTYKYVTNYNKLKYCNNSSYGLNGYTDNKTVLDPEDDAATANWGSGWRMPTYDEVYELYTECTNVWTTQGGKNGQLFMGPNGNTVFLPAAGYYYGSSLDFAGSYGFYWSSSLDSDNPYYAYGLGFHSGSVDWGSGSLYCGQSVRPVVANSNPTATYLRVDVPERSLGADGGTFTVQVESDKSWSVSCDQSWVTLSATSGSGNGSFSVMVAANESNVADNATITVTTATGNVTKTIAITRQGQGGTGTLQGHDYVDLGLPSGTLWATCNVGADSPEVRGDYFALGETSPKSDYSWSTYKYGTSSNQLTKYCNNSSYGKNGFTDGKTVLDAEDDAATANWGANWRIPTTQEQQELINECTWTWTKQNGASGRLVTGPNGKTIFFPTTGSYNGGSPLGENRVGDYWSSSVVLEDPSYAYYLDFSSTYVDWKYDELRRYFGRCIRPVVVVNPDPNAAYLSLSFSQKSTEAAGGEFIVSVTSNKSWSVSCNQSWVTLSTTSGTGNGSFSVLIAANESNTADNATITVTTATGNVTQTVAVSRAANVPHEYVDLGLPSGTLWATCNVGANSPEEYGDYFAWGETTPKSYYDWSTYKYGTDYNKLTKYCNNSSYGLNGYTDNKTVLDPEDDAATANWGGGWRMPTYDEIVELYNNCTSVWTTQGGKNGRLFTGVNGNAIFLPVTGYYYGTNLSYADMGGCYWSSSLYSGDSNGAYYLDFNSDFVYWDDYYGRYIGFPVRPVITNPNPAAAYLRLNVSERSLGAEGGNFTVQVESNKSWSVSCNQSWVTLSATSGSGNGSFSVLVAANGSNTADNATITVTTTTGNVTQLVEIQRSGKSEFDALLNGAGYIVYYMDDRIYSSISSRVLLDLRPNDEYIFLSDQTGSSFDTPAVPDPFYGGYDYLSLQKGSASWAGLYIYAAENNGYKNDVNAMMDTYESLVKGHESEWTLVLIMRSNNEESQPLIRYYGFGDRSYEDSNLTNLPSSDGLWHSYMMRLDEWGEYNMRNLAEFSGDTYWYTSLIDFVGSLDVCAAFLVCDNAFETNKYINVSPRETLIPFTGGSLDVKVFSNTSWSVSCNQPWVTLSATSGSGNGSFSVQVAANESSIVETAFITVFDDTGKTQFVEIRRTSSGGTISGHDYVNLGLPSGTLWATCNVGANFPEEYGDYFAWGETDPKTDYSWSTYKYGKSSNRLTKYCYSSSFGQEGFIDEKTVLEAQDDAATDNWGNNWRMPTVEEMEELYNNCTSVWTTQDGIDGLLFIGPYGNSLFLPGSYISGRYWSSSLSCCSFPYYARVLTLGNVSSTYNLRHEGLFIRPVVANLNPDATYLRLDVSEHSFEAEGGNFSVRIKSNKAWTVSCDQSWVTLSATSGSGNGSFSVQVAANRYNTVDNAIITVTTATGNVTQTIAVSRAANKTLSGTLSDHDYVDLGLASGTLWATCNVGANSPEEYGDYFAWGETIPKSNYYTWSTYKYGTSSNQMTKYCYNRSYGKNGFTDTHAILEEEDDAATANWGGNWRMPNKDEIEELYNSCTCVWVTQNDKEGCLFTGPNGNTLFLPSAGYYDENGLNGAGGSVNYWSNELYDDGPSRACYFNGYRCFNALRYHGNSVRPVVAKSDPNVDYLCLDLHEQVLGAEGGNFTVRVVCNKCWTVSCDQPWVTISATNGSANGSFTVQVAPNGLNTADIATITVTTTGNVTKNVIINRNARSSGTVSAHDYIDLGLPSGTLWATCNVGANSPNEYGYYFAWGELQVKSDYQWSTYKYGTGGGQLIKYCNNSSNGWNGFTDTKIELDPEDDAATANWGSNWRMPTLMELQELYNNCTRVWTTQGGKNGLLLTGPNGNAIFLPASGYSSGINLYHAAEWGVYMSSSLNTDNPRCAYGLFFSSDYVDWDDCGGRIYGRSVRPVVNR